MFVSTKTKSEILKIAGNSKYLGYVDKDLYVPPKCPVCGDFLAISNYDENFGQCYNCNGIFKLSYFE